MNKRLKDISLDVFIGRKIREKRIKLGWTLDELSKKLTISYQQVQKYELGASRISSTLILALSSIFCVSPNYFFDGYPLSDSPSFETSKLIKGRTAPLSVLIIEPDSNDRIWTTRAFEAVKPATNSIVVNSGHEAIELLRNPMPKITFRKADIIITEINLPNENWRTLIKDIRLEPNYKFIPIICLTNSINYKDMLDAYQYNCTSFICKMYDFPNFKKSIENLIKYWGTVVSLP